MSAIIEACRRIRDKSTMSAIAARSLQLQRAGREWKACCPFHPERTPSFTIYADDRHWYCHGACSCGGDQLDFIRKLHSVSLRQAIEMVDSGALPVVQPKTATFPERNSDTVARALTIWRNAVPAAGTLAESYLRSRGLICRIPESIRFARLRYPRGDVMPCLVALIASVENKAIGIQRTYLNASGTGKAAVPEPKLSLGHVRGGAIRLAPAAAELIVCEGLEDGLTLQQEMGTATWAAAGAGNLSKLELPPGVRSVIIGADRDPTGERTARGAGRRFADQGRKAWIVWPLSPHKDFNAELMAGAPSCQR